MKLFKKNENKKTTKLPMTGKFRNRLDLPLSGIGFSIIAWRIIGELRL